MTKLLSLLALLALSTSASATITQVQSKTASSGGTNAASLSLVFDTQPTAGNVLIIAANNSASGLNMLRITEQAGLSWTVYTRSGSSGSICLFVGRVSSTIASSTITLTGPSGPMAAVGAEYTGSVGALRLDRQAAATASSGTAVASGATETTSTAAELWVGGGTARGNGTLTYTQSGSWAIVGQTGTTNNTANADVTVALVQQIVSGTSTPNAAMTSSASGHWAAAILTFDETPASTTTASTNIPSIGGR